MLTSADMEQVLESLDRRLRVIEQTLPTLATADQFEDVNRFARVLNEETNKRIDLVAEGLTALTERVEDLPTRQEFRALADTADDVKTGVTQMAGQLSKVTTRLEQKGVI